jgi:3-phosphoshikimate 1-carboxyvinyltransferase
MTILSSNPVSKILGSIEVPGDKSISHRALMIGAISIGETRISGMLTGEDVIKTSEAISSLGIDVLQERNGDWRVFGVGVGGLREPNRILDLGNSGTGARLLMGLLATHDLTAQLTGDASLRRRPMQRVVEPLTAIGARVLAADGNRLPLSITGTSEPLPLDYVLPVPSAQVKSAILLAGLNTPGFTSVTESQPTRNHTELMLRNFGAELKVEALNNGSLKTTLTGQPELKGQSILIPGDPSSAAFPAVAALIAKKGQVTIPNVGLNPLRIGLFRTLLEMGAKIEFKNPRTEAGERVADLKVCSSELTGVVVPAERAPSMIDEYPILAVAAAFAKGTTRMLGLSELRVKECDRLSAIFQGLRTCGVRTHIEGDDLIVEGDGKEIRGDGRITTHMDHRIAMAFLVAGVASRNPISIDNDSHISTSFPGFAELMNLIGAKLS